MSEFWNAVTSYPVNVFSIPFCVLFSLMVIDLVFDLFDGGLGDTEIGELDTSWSSQLFLPPIISKIPLPIALSVSSFFAMIITYYSDHFLFSSLSGLPFYGVTVIALPAIFYLALYLSAFVLKPLGSLFDKKKAFAAINYEGMRAFVRSSKINDSQGEVVIKQGSNEIQLDVYCDVDTEIPYGEEVVIVSKNTDNDRYLVIKM